MVDEFALGHGLEELAWKCSRKRRWAPRPDVDEMGWVQPVTMPNGAEAKTVGFPIGLTDYEFEI
ncbi:hypothetical protein ACIKT0_15885, partial [Hansschlegelia beijingensis]|uniref:hypothetical protein n=1 Tax=Hansschlegelia beijingensis TaxID=1133344 RepID=UPI00387F2D20